MRSQEHFYLVIPHSFEKISVTKSSPEHWTKWSALFLSQGSLLLSAFPELFKDEKERIKIFEWKEKEMEDTRQVRRLGIWT